MRKLRNANGNIVIGSTVIVRYDRYSQIRPLFEWWGNPKNALNFLCVVGSPGYGKTALATAALQTYETDYHKFDGKTSVRHIVEELEKEPDLPILIDDLTSIMRHKDMTDIFKPILVNKPRRRVRYKVKGFDCDITITGRVCCLLNELPQNNVHVEAIVDRLTTYEFEPVKDAVLDHLASY